MSSFVFLMLQHAVSVALVSTLMIMPVCYVVLTCIASYDHQAIRQNKTVVIDWVKKHIKEPVMWAWTFCMSFMVSPFIAM